MGILIGPDPWVGNLNQLQQFSSLYLGLMLGKIPMAHDYLCDLLADSIHRIKRSRWVLEDVANLPPSNLPHFFVCQSQELLPLEVNRACDDLPWRRHNSQ